MNILKFNSIRKTFLFASLTLVVFLLGVFGIFITIRSNANIRSMMDSKGRSVVELMVKTSKSNIENFDYVGLDDLVNVVLADKEVAFAAVYDENNALLTKIKPPEDISSIITFERDIKDVNNKLLGFVKLGYNTKNLSKSLRYNLFINICIVVILGVAIAVLLIILLEKVIIHPLNQVIDKMKDKEGDLTKRINISNNDEMGLLAKWFNKFMENLQGIIISINGISSLLASASQDMVLKTKKVTDGTDSQMKSVTSTLSSIEKIIASNKGIVEAVNELSVSAEKSSSAVLESNASVKELSKSSEAISNAVDSTAMSIIEMAASIKQVAENTTALNSTTKETEEAMKQIEEAIAQIKENTNQSVKLSEQSTKDAAAGMTSVTETIKGINLINDSVGNASTVIVSLGKQISSIDEILVVIDTVAEQTNLLALNAAIIAAQAGKHGKGFAIVADEIKALANKTAASTKEIANIIITVQKESENAIDTMKVSAKNVTNSVILSKEAGKMLEKILANAEQSTTRLKDIANSTVMQSKKTSEVMKTMIDISTKVNQISAATKEQNVGSNLILKATESIKEIAFQLKTAVQEQAVAEKNISSEITNITQMFNQIINAIIIQKEQSASALSAIRTINDNAQDNQRIISDLDNIVEILVNKSKALNNEIDKFKVSS